jgi:hypothetical protein
MSATAFHDAAEPPQTIDGIIAAGKRAAEAAERVRRDDAARRLAAFVRRMAAGDGAEDAGDLAAMMETAGYSPAQVQHAIDQSRRVFDLLALHGRREEFRAAVLAAADEYVRTAAEERRDVLAAQLRYAIDEVFTPGLAEPRLIDRADFRRAKAAWPYALDDFKRAYRAHDDARELATANVNALVRLAFAADFPAAPEGVTAM